MLLLFRMSTYTVCMQRPMMAIKGHAAVTGDKEEKMKKRYNTKRHKKGWDDAHLYTRSEGTDDRATLLNQHHRGCSFVVLLSWTAKVRLQS